MKFVYDAESQTDTLVSERADYLTAERMKDPHNIDIRSTLGRISDDDYVCGLICIFVKFGDAMGLLRLLKSHVAQDVREDVWGQASRDVEAVLEAQRTKTSPYQDRRDEE